ncbi:MATE family efflux transporter [uncultured Xylophilus sp.]|uniref:MATE family efflux transporter n=1 Tax=uncultured Xylophilus sp. TaxID=296832 RepID=UPI0025F2274E|nr:MATE family efflux transporter [uncultured Xylophilus sp.]
MTAAASPADGWRGEFPAIARHAVTVLAGQLAVMAFGVTDTVMAGRHSETSLAALSVGSAIFVSVYVALMGVFQALLPVWAEQRGADRPQDVGRSVRQSLYLWLVLSLLGMAVLSSPGPLLRWASVPLALQAEVGRYLGVLAWALPAALLFRIFSTLNQSLGHPRLVTWLQIGSLGLKIPLSAWFALGGPGVAPMGAVGCAVATLLVHQVMLVIAVCLVRSQARYRPYALWQPLERPDGAQLKLFLRLGVPAGMAILVEVTSFTLMALFIARQGTLPTAGHQIATSIAALLYMVPLSLGIAASARVGYWLGAGAAARARMAVSAGFVLLALSASTLAAIIFIARGVLPGFYTGNPAVATVASGLLAWVAVYHLADALQCFCVFVLRCYRITFSALAVYGVMLWGVGLGGGYALAYRGVAGMAAQPAPETFWMSSAAALWVTAAVFVVMVRWAVRRRT